MKILLIHCAYQFRGGEDTVVEEETKLLTSQGHEVEVLGFSNQGKQWLKLLQLPFNITSYRATRKKIKAFKPDVVHIHNLHFAASPSVVYAVKHSQTPMVMTLHNFRLLCPSGILFENGKLFLDSLNEKFPVTAVKKAVYKNSRITTFWVAAVSSMHQWLNTFTVPDKVICLTEHSRQLFSTSKLKFKPGQLVVKPNFITPPNKEMMPRGNHFLFVGRLTEEKGIKMLLDTFALSNLTLLIAGDGPLKTKVQQYATDYNNIYYLGNLDSNQVTEAMQAATALVFPSEWYEGMPLTIIESFSSGLPVIASDLGAMQAMVTDGENGFLFEPYNKADFQKALYKWAHFDNHKREMFRQNAKATYNHLYSPQKNLEQLTNIYRSVIDCDRAPILSIA